MSAAEAVEAVVSRCGLSVEVAEAVVKAITAEANYETAEAVSEVTFVREEHSCGSECCGSWYSLRIEGPSGVIEAEYLTQWALEFGLLV